MGFMELTPIGYRYKEAGKLLTVSEPTVIRLIQAGKLERLQITENRFVVSRESLSAYMEAVKSGGDLRAYRYTPQNQRRSSTPDERKGLVAGVLSRFGLGAGSAGR